MTFAKALSSALIVSMMSATAYAQMPPASDAEFVMKASVGNTFEIQEAQLAKERATMPALKSFADKMVADHSDAMKKLQDAAQAANQKSEMMLDAPHQAMLDNLKAQQGADFDKIYQADQVAAHAETVNLLLDYQTNGKNDRLMGWVKEALPVVKGHQATINAMP